MRVLLTGVSQIYSYDEFKGIIKNLDNVQITGIICDSYDRHPDWHPDNTGLNSWTDSEILDGRTHFERTPFHDEYERVRSVLLTDSRTFFLIERLFSNGGKDSVFNNTVKVEIIIWNSLTILYKSKPDRMVAGSIPHNYLWFVAKVAELMGVEVYFNPECPLPWKRWVVKDLELQTPLQLQKGDLEGNQAVDTIHQFINKIHSSYEVAIPEYEKRRMKRYNGGFFSLKQEFYCIIKAPSLKRMLYRVYRTIKKKQSFDVYCSHTNNFKYPDKFIIFFLHLQPERTTLPEGYQFAQQWLAIRMLADSLPSDWYLVVKEHPSMFRYLFDPQVRDSQFYDAINALPNVTLSPLEVPPFELIDRSMIVSTITGTVGIEALIRGKPVVVFGAAQYRGAKGVFAVKTISDIKSVIQNITSGFVMPSDDELIEYFSWVDRNSFEKDRGVNYSTEAFMATLTIK